MAPKKKKGGKKGKKAKEEKEPDDEYRQMHVEQLEIIRTNLTEQLGEAKIKRNMLQIEKDMIHDFYHNTREEIKELEARIKNYDTWMQEAEEKHRTDVASHLQKVKHLEYENQNNCEKVKQDGQTYMKDENTSHTTTEKENMKEKKQLKNAYGEDDRCNIGDIDEKEHDLKTQNDEMRKNLEANKKELIQKYEEKMRELEAQLQLRMKVEIHEIEERKNQHINELMVNHESAFQEMKAYYNDITRENIELIKVHKDKLKEIKAQISGNDYIVADLKKKEKDMQIPLQRAQQKRDGLFQSTKTFDKDKMALTNMKGCLKDFSCKLKDIRKKKDDLEKEYKQVKEEKEDMYVKFEKAIEQLQSRANYKNEQLEQKLGVFTDDMEKKELTLRELVQRSGLDQGTVDDITKKMEEAIEAKNSILRNLRYSLAHATKAYNDAIRVYEAKLVEFGIPAEELGLEPLATNTSTMPAGLVAA